MGSSTNPNLILLVVMCLRTVICYLLHYQLYISDEGDVIVNGLLKSVKLEKLNKNSAILMCHGALRFFLNCHKLCRPVVTVLDKLAQKLFFKIKMQFFLGIVFVVCNTR